ncbi:MAG TPA: GDP-mannose 4,6-dehydratase [Burkholderiales bacterium]|nr:GDP-mannose 4,6-dehydratase [Burkholderiales bacterium]
MAEKQAKQPADKTTAKRAERGAKSGGKSIARGVPAPSLCGQKVLITGGLGFIGSNLAHRCLELGAQVTVFDSLDPRSGGNLHNVHAIPGRIEIVFQSVLDFGQLARYLDGKDIVFNCAASTSHPFSMREPWMDLDVNGVGVINMLEAVRRYNREVKFIHLGTSTQLGKLRYKPADESHPEFPTDIYSTNKTVSEKYVLVYANAYNLRAATIRLSNVYGQRATIHSPDFTFNNYFVGLALQDKAITVYGEGTQLRNVLHVDDAVSALVLASQSEKVNGETFFAVGDDHYSVAQLAEETVKAMGSGRVEYIAWPGTRKAIEVGDAVLSNAKIKGVLGWAPTVALQPGLAKTKAYYRDCLAKYLR